MYNPSKIHLDRSISELNIWQATGATVIAISHNEELLVSPGPYAKFTAGDIVHFIGNEYTLQRMTNFFYPEHQLAE